MRILRSFGLGWKFIALLVSIVPRFVRDPLYRWIARNRYRMFGRRAACRRADGGHRRPVFCTELSYAKRGRSRRIRQFREESRSGAGGGSHCRVVVAGRDFQQARAVADSVGFPAEPVALDMRATNLAAELRWLDAGVVVHAAGPFQGQDYAVARACIEARAHYVDLADARGYVCGIGVLDEAARGGDVLVVSGASSVPALSSAVVDMLGREFSQIESIEHGITSGAKPPGLAAMEGVLGYVGKPIKQWRGGQWRTVIWMAGPRASQVSVPDRRALARQLRCA